MSKWNPQDDEPALTLAAIRWYAMSLEKLATDLYLTNREDYPAVQGVLSTAFKELGRMRGYCVENARSKTPVQRVPAGRWADQLVESKVEDGQKPQIRKFMLSADDGCGPGYVNCNGICLPECDNVAEY